MATAELLKVDLLRQHAALYRPPEDPVLVTVPSWPFLMIDGVGDPATSATFQDAVQALYGLAYPLKFALRKEVGLDYTVMPLEGLWHGAGEMEPPSPDAFLTADRSAWRWTLMIRQPVEAVDALFGGGTFRSVLATARGKRPGIPYGSVRLEMLDEGECAQLMHRGPYAEELPSILRLHEFIRSLGRAPRGPHHEIYLGDPRRAAPQALRTVLRHAVSPAL